MAFNPFRKAVPAMRAHIIRVTGQASTDRFAVLAADAGEALATVAGNLGLADIAEVTGEILPPSATARLGLEPGRPLRLT